GFPLLLCLALCGCDSPASTTTTKESASPVNVPPSAAPQAAQSSAPDVPASATQPSKPQQPAPPDVAEAPQDAKKTPSGLASKVLTKGTGTKHPTADDSVTVNYTGWTKDGKMFDTSAGGDPVSFPLKGVIKGWTEGLPLMVEGEKRRFWIPGSLAYGD